MMTLINLDKKKQDPKLKEKHKERKIKKDMLNKIKNDEWQLEVKDYKKND
jgi:hypothetical protein